MRKLTIEEISSLSSKKNVRKIAVENFLGTMGEDRGAACDNLSLDARLYNWNAQTINAILKGIYLASKE